jgi:hypothetical protein
LVRRERDNESGLPFLARVDLDDAAFNALDRDPAVEICLKTTRCVGERERTVLARPQGNRLETQERLIRDGRRIAPKQREDITRDAIGAG